MSNRPLSDKIAAMTPEPDSIQHIPCIQLASTNVGDQSLFARDTNDQGQPWKRIRTATSTLTPHQLEPGENRWLRACTVDLEDGARLVFNDEDLVEVATFRSKR
jgi:hypothetical protein